VSPHVPANKIDTSYGSRKVLSNLKDLLSSIRALSSISLFLVVFYSFFILHPSLALHLEILFIPFSQSILCPPYIPCLLFISYPPPIRCLVSIFSCTSILQVCLM
jgi:hypothetical protein